MKSPTVFRFAKDIPNPKGKRGFVPTMGALHQGHASLLDRARSENDEILLSIFVNPTQFAPHEDFHKYPRSLESDLAIATSCGVDLVYSPNAEDIYPLGEAAIQLDVGEIGTLWEGKIRPNHFNGVALVVLRLLIIACSDNVYFGQKDLQQTVVIRRLIHCLGLRINMVVCPTIRESDGLALSSRNVYLNSEERLKATNLYQTLSELESHFSQNFSEPLDGIMNKYRNELSRYCNLDYLELVDLNSLHCLDSFQAESALIVAGRFGNTRLLDNLIL